MKKKIMYLLAGSFLSFMLVSCGEEEKPIEQIRSIKTFKVSSQATGQTRKFSGIVSAVNYSFLSFEDVEGRVVKLNVDIGDKVTKGQVLAVLDKQKYELDVKNAQANLKKAEANLVKATSEYNREKELFAKQASFQQRLDTRKFQYEAAVSEEKSAKAGLGLANRSLQHTELKTPFDGFVGERFIQPNQEVSKGAKIFRIDEKGAMEIQFSIPETLRKRLALGSEGIAKFAGNAEPDVKCKISFLGTAANQGNAFPAKAVLINSPVSVKPGMTAETSFILPMEGKGASGFLIPVTAVLMGKDAKSGFVFVYNPATSTVKKTKVHFGGSQGNLGIVKSGLNEGDLIADAGVSFLLDGMKVNLYKPAPEGGE